MRRKISRDPYWTTAKFASTCSHCKRTINKDEKIFYYPNTRSVFCNADACGWKESASFAGAVADERMYNS